MSKAEPPDDALRHTVYQELHRLAHRALARRPSGQTLQTTALLHEAWLKLRKETEWESEDHFLAVAARAMHSILIDHARRRGADRRGGRLGRIDLDEAVGQLEASSTGLLALEDALQELAQRDEELAHIVELRFFGGLKHPAIAQVKGISLRRVERGWSMARAWLYARLNEGTK